MPQKKKMRKVNLGFVDFGEDPSPEPGKDYPLVDVGSRRVGEVPVPETEFKVLSLQLLSLYIEDLPDFGHKNEGLLKLGAVTRTRDDKANKEDLTASVEFNVRDRDYAPGFLRRAVFRNILFQRYFELSLNLVELDKDFAEAYGKVATVVDDAGLSSIDALNAVPYLKVATKLFDGLIRTFGKNADDLVWSEAPTLDLRPAAGGAFLRSGIYLLYETRTIHPRRQAKKKEAKTVPIQKLLYRDSEIRHKDDGDFPLPNHLLFNIQLEPFQE